MFTFICPSCGTSAASSANAVAGAGCARCAGPLALGPAIDVAPRPLVPGAEPAIAITGRDARFLRQRIARGEAQLVRAVAEAGAARSGGRLHAQATAAETWEVDHA
jgi:hypothetical protein